MKRGVAATAAMLSWLWAGESAAAPPPGPARAPAARSLQVLQHAVRKTIADLMFAQGEALAKQEYRRVHFYEDGHGYCAYPVSVEAFNAPMDPDRVQYVVDPVTLEGATIKLGSGEVTFGPAGTTVTWSGSAIIPGSGGKIAVVNGEGGYDIMIAPATGKMSVSSWRGPGGEEPSDPMREFVRAQLQSIRARIELYNVEHPAAPYNAKTPLATFWSALVDGEYLSIPPRNPMQDNSSTVGARPGPGIAWVWGELPGKPLSLTLHAVDADGNWFDESIATNLTRGPKAKEAACKGALEIVRPAIAVYFANKVIKENREIFPTAAELVAPGRVLARPLPENPYSHDNRIAAATRIQAKSREVVGSGEGWAYYDGSGGGTAVFYANSNTVGENGL